MIIVLVVEYKLFFAASIFLVNVFRVNATIFKIWFMGSVSSDKSVVMIEILRTTMIILGLQQCFLFDNHLYFFLIHEIHIPWKPTHQEHPFILRMVSTISHIF